MYANTAADELKDIQPKKVITGLSGWILSMNVLDQYLYTGGDDKMIHVWSLAKDCNLSDIFFRAPSFHADPFSPLGFLGLELFSFA